MKYLMIIGDGMADYPVKELGGETPLQSASHPNMDRLAQGGVCGLARTIPKGMGPNTDVAILSILGYNPKLLEIGRGPLEAASMGVVLEEHDVALRFNIVTEEKGILKDYAAGHISTEDAAALVSALNDSLGEPNLRFYPGISYRHLLVLGDRYSKDVTCYPAHDVVGRNIADILVKPKKTRATRTATLLNSLILKSQTILSNHALNGKRKQEGKPPANMIWPWGPGRRPKISTLRERFGLSSAVISAVDVVNGMGKYAGMDVITVPGATGFVDTNYEGKADYALQALKDHDFVLVHVEAPDEAGHMGDPRLKIKTIEDLDRRLLGRILDGIKGDFTIAIMSDHLTPIPVRTHTDDPVPFVFYCSRRRKRGQPHFNEVSASEGPLKIGKGYRLFDLFLKYGRA